MMSGVSGRYLKICLVMALPVIVTTRGNCNGGEVKVGEEGYRLSNAAVTSFNCESTRDLCNGYGYLAIVKNTKELRVLAEKICCQPNVYAFYARVKLNKTDIEVGGKQCEEPIQCTVSVVEQGHNCVSSCVEKDYEIRKIGVNCSKGGQCCAYRPVLCVDVSQEEFLTNCSLSTPPPSTVSATKDPTVSDTDTPKSATSPWDDMPREAFEALKKELAEKWKRELTLDKATLSKIRARKISAPDARRSSQAMGGVAIIFLSTFFGLIVLSDLQKLYRWWRQRKEENEAEEEDAERGRAGCSKERTTPPCAGGRHGPPAFAGQTLQPAAAASFVTRESSQASRRSTLTQTDLSWAKQRGWVKTQR